MARNLEDMVYLSDDPEHYTKTYVTFNEHCSTSMSQAQCPSKPYAALVASAFNKELIRKLEAAHMKPEPLRVLSVGSGRGDIDCAILKQLLPSFPNISNTVVEPSLSQLDLFRERIQEPGGTLEGITFHWRQQTSDEYLNEITAGASQHSERTDDRFHLVTAIHMLYYVDDWKETIGKYYDLLEEGGLLFIVVSSAETTTLRAWAKMNKYQENLRPLLLTDAEVQSELEKINLPYSTGQIPLYTRATAVFDETSQEGNELLDFTTHTKNFRNSAPDDLRELILEFLKSPEVSCKTDDRDVYFFRHWNYITITK